MVALVSLDQVKLALRIDSPDFDADLEYKIGAASECVLRYLKVNVSEYYASGDVFDSDLVPDDVQLATMMLVGYFFRNPDSDPDKDFEMGYLPRPVMSMLYSRRDPTIA